MKTQRKLLKRKARSLHGFSLEALEVRNLLAANVLATANDSISSPGGMDNVEMLVALPSSPRGTATFAIRTIAEDGSGLDPAAPVIRDADGDVMTGMSMDDADGTTGMTVVELGAGPYTLEVSGESSSTGAYRVEVALLGDVSANDGMVSSTERLQATAALIQFLGTGNHVTDLLFRQNGIDPTVDQYDPGMDVNMNGHVDPHELGMIEDNASTGAVIVTLQADSDAPVFSGLGLANDTGVSASDRISTDPTINGTIIEQNAVASVVASLDGGSNVDITASLGDLTGGGNFTLTRSLLDTIAGGSLAAGAHTLRLSAVDDAGNETNPPAEFSFTFIAGSQGPVGTDLIRAASEDTPYVINLNNLFTDANPGDPLTFTATIPAWLTLNQLTGRLEGTPLNEDVGQVDIPITATDSQGLTGMATLSLTVFNTNDAPVVTAVSPDPQTAFEDTLYSLDIGSLVSDPDTINVSDVVTISVDRASGVQPNGDPINLQPLPGWLTFNEVTGILSGTPTQNDVDTLPQFGVLITAVDEAGESGFDFFMINVEQTPEPPEFIGSIENQTVDQDSQFSLDVSINFDDPDGASTLSYSATLENGSALPAWLFLNATTGVLAGTPTNADVGTLSIVVTATDNTNLTAMSNPFTVTVSDINDAPSIANQSFSVDADATAGTSLGTIVASDPDTADTLTFAVTGGTGTNDFVVNPATGQITVASGAMLVDQSVLTLVVEVTDSGTPQLSASATMTISVGAQPPSLVNDNAGPVDDTEILTIAQSELLSNDTDPGSLTFVGVSGTSNLGATVTISGADVLYDPSSSMELVGLMEGQFRDDTFTYTASGPGGATAQATVTVRVDGAQAVAVRLRTFDSNGNEVTQITPDAVFELRAFVQDISADPEGIFSAFIDVEYNNNPVVATLNGDIVHSGDFDLTTNGVASPGLIDEVGGLSGLDPTGGAEFELFRQAFVASGNPGQTVMFTSNPSETPGLNGILLFGQDFQLADVQIQFGGTNLNIVAPSPLSGGGSSLSTNTNPDNAYDVNADEMISPIDALMVVNQMGGAAATAPGSHHAYTDVNADGNVSPLDALMVINRLGGGAVTAPPVAPLSGSTSLTDANGPVDTVFADLGNDPSSDFGVPQIRSATVINPIDLDDAASDDDADEDETTSVDLLLGLE